MRPFDGELVRGIPWLVNIRGVATWFHATLNQNNRLGKGRSYGVSAKGLTDGRTLMMMMMMMMMKMMMMMMMSCRKIFVLVVT